jgi:hypothetical protein
MLEGRRAADQVATEARAEQADPALVNLWTAA